ncbi:MAG TPA: TIGR02186 family protein [Azospirillaceae bacterium]|nr:TIGR02186 family protein [Azospirillaceae bacterium]
MRRWAVASMVAVGVMLAGWMARAETLVADLSSHLIAITTGFTGTEVVLFGAVEQPGDIAVVVTGPRADVVVRRKARTVGIWLNRDSLAFQQVPGFYMLATNRPLDRLLPEPVLERHEIGLNNMALVPSHKATLERPGAEIAEYREALIRNKQKLELYPTALGQVAFLGQHLFRTNVYFPANVPTGVYTVSVYLIRDGDVVSAQTTPLVVSKVGFSAEIFEFAQRQSLVYGLAAVMGAITAGWLAGAVFRRV